MNWDRIEGNWKQAKGKIKEQWGKLTDDHLDTIGGKRDQLVGKIQEHYGVAKDEAERQVNDWENAHPRLILGQHCRHRSTPEHEPVRRASAFPYKKLEE